MFKNIVKCNVENKLLKFQKKKLIALKSANLSFKTTIVKNQDTLLAI